MGIPDHLTCLLRNLTRAQCLSSPHPGVRDSRDWGHSDSSIQKAQKYNWTQTLAKVPDHTGDREAYNNHALTFESWEVQVDLWVLCAQSLRHIHLFPIPWTVARQAPLSMGFSRKEYWSGLPFPTPRDLPNPGVKSRSLALHVDSLPSEPPRKPKNTGLVNLSLLQGIFPTQESNPCLLLCKQSLYQLSYQGSPCTYILFIHSSVDGLLLPFGYLE